MIYRSVVTILSFFLTSSVLADTQKIDNTAYGVVIERPMEVTMTNGAKVMTGGLFHANSVDANGEVNSQWCRSTTALGDEGPVAGGGYCTIIAENGDLLFVWFGGGNWGVINGTGRYEGATGGGTTTGVSQNPDGYAYTNKSKGKIKLK